MAESTNLDRDFLDLMTQTVLLAPLASLNSYGKAKYGSDVSYQGRVVGKNMELRTFDGEEVTSTFMIWLDTIDQILTTHRITLSGTEWGDNLTPLIFTVRRVTDENDHSHVQLSCGWQYHRQGQ